jgi:hypothetical protein
MNFNRYKPLALVLFCAMLLPAFALSGGKASPALNYSAVIQINFETEDDEWTCTASKIAPYKYLTAAHCVSDPGNGQTRSFERIRFSHGNSEDSTYFQDVSVKEFDVHPGWKNHVYLLPLRKPEDRLETGTDQAIIEINEPNDLPELALDFKEVQDGEVLLAAGYGIQSVAPGHFLPSGQLRVLRKRVSQSFFQPKVVALGAVDSNGQTYSQFAPGDSGGPILRLTPAERIPFAPKLSIVGTMSYIRNLIFVNPDTGMLTEDYTLEPTSHFVRNQSLSYLFQFKGLEQSFRLSSWLEQKSFRFQKNN